MPTQSRGHATQPRRRWGRDWRQVRARAGSIASWGFAEGNGAFDDDKKDPAIRIAGYKSARTWRMHVSAIDLVIAVHSDARVVWDDAVHNGRPRITHYKP